MVEATNCLFFKASLFRRQVNAYGTPADLLRMLVNLLSSSNSISLLSRF